MDSAEFESNHVHTVYSAIASDFSRTRHSGWQFVIDFLSLLPIGTIVLDVGCGNGKYFSTREGILVIGLDYSRELLELAKRDGIRSTALFLGTVRREVVACCISIAVIHHFITLERRIQAIAQMIQVVTPKKNDSSVNTILVTAWAYEQDPSLFGKGSARRKGKNLSTVEEDQQDVFVGWNLKSKIVSTEGGKDVLKEENFNRFYHLFKYGELTNLVQEAAKELGYSYVQELNPRSSQVPTAEVELELEKLNLDSSTAEPLEANGTKEDAPVEVEKSIPTKKPLESNVGEKKLQVELLYETWERENWVVEIGVSWV